MVSNTKCAVSFSCPNLHVSWWNNVVWERWVDSIVESCAVCCSAAVFYQCNGVRRQPTLDVLVKFSPENALLHETSLQISFLWKMMLHAFRQIHLVFKILKLRQLGDTAPLWEEWDWEQKGYIQENKWQYFLWQLPIRMFCTQLGSLLEAK